MSSRGPAQQPSFVVTRHENRTAQLSNSRLPIRQEQAQQASTATLPRLWQQAQIVEALPTVTRTEPDDGGNTSSDDDTEEQPEENHEPSLDQNRETVVHPKGTLCLIVGGDQRQNGARRIIVSPDLKHLSAQFKDIVVRSTRDGFWGKRAARLPDDDADMMLVLMWIVNVDFSKVPKTLDFNQLLEMARICFRYGVNARVSPFLDKWITPHRSKILNPGNEQWLYIAHQFGLIDDCAKLTKHLVLNCRVDVDGRLLIPGTKKVAAGHFPEDCLTHLGYARLKAIAALFNTVYNFVVSMIDHNICRVNLAQTGVAHDERSLCTLFNHGVIIRYLKMLGYWPPIPTAKLIPDTVNEVAAKLRSVPEIKMPPTRHDSVIGIAAQGTTGTLQTTPLTGNRHEACDAGRVIAAKVQEVLDRLPVSFTEETLEIVKNNARYFRDVNAMEWPKNLLVIHEEDLTIS